MRALSGSGAVGGRCDRRLTSDLSAVDDDAVCRCGDAFPSVTRRRKILRTMRAARAFNDWEEAID